jgi:hypothetical protein
MTSLCSHVFHTHWVLGSAALTSFFTPVLVEAKYEALKKIFLTEKVYENEF